jgi:hypothetical protein
VDQLGFQLLDVLVLDLIQPLAAELRDQVLSQDQPLAGDCAGLLATTKLPT